MSAAVPPRYFRMTQISFIAFDGTRFDLTAENGSTVMENAIRNSVPGIEAECGGACACASFRTGQSPGPHSCPGPGPCSRYRSGRPG